MASRDRRHRLKLTLDGGFVRAELVHPPDGCDHPVDEGVADESVPCWIETWEDELIEYASNIVLGEFALDLDWNGDTPEIKALMYVHPGT